MLEQLTAIIKAFTYLAVFGGAGAVLAHASLLRGQAMAETLARYVRVSGIILALAASGAAFVYMRRLADSIDYVTFETVVWSPLGAGLALQGAAGLWLAVFASKRLALIGAVLALLSFAVVGHSATFGASAAISLLIHIFAASWWLGGLALLLANRNQVIEAYSLLVSRFSRIGLWIVASLVVSAVITAAQLLRLRIDAANAYDLGLIAKAGLTLGLLALAATNRLFLSPRLKTSPSALKWLYRSIIAEISLFLAIFATTAWLTTWHSPHDGSHEAAKSSGPITIIDAWAPATPGTLTTGAGYLTIINNQPSGDRLLSVTSPWAETVTVHISTSNGQVVGMRELVAPAIPANGRLKFSPGGMHLMLTGLYSPLVAGDNVPVTIRFERAGEVTLDLNVLPLGERPNADHVH
jgi:copper(I)-binding protein